MTCTPDPYARQRYEQEHACPRGHILDRVPEDVLGPVLAVALYPLWRLQHPQGSRLGRVVRGALCCSLGAPLHLCEQALWTVHPRRCPGWERAPW